MRNFVLCRNPSQEIIDILDRCDKDFRMIIAEMIEVAIRDEGNAFVVISALDLNDMIGNLLAKGYTVETVKEEERIFPIHKFSYRHIKHLIGIGLTSFLGLAGISSGTAALMLSLPLIAVSVVGSQILSGGMVGLGVICFCLFLAGTGLLVNRFSKEPKLPEKVAFQTACVDTYSQLLTEYLIKHPDTYQDKTNKDACDASDHDLNQAYKVAKHIFNGKRFFKDEVVGKKLMQELVNDFGYNEAKVFIDRCPQI